MTSNNYIVKNCPAYDYDEEFNYHICKQPLVPYEGNVDDCEKCSDCIIKQVIEKCKTIIEKDYKEEDRHLFSEDDLKILDRTWFDVGLGCKKTARQVLQLFNIEEVQ